MPDTATARARLQAQLAELGPRFDHIVRDLDTPADRDSEEHAIEVEDDEALEHQAALVTAEIASVKRALARIDDGTYGQCVRCGEPIADARLEAQPEAALCIGCARQSGAGAAGD
jgi:RNA polymerase-binding transcription factor DksA